MCTWLFSFAWLAWLCVLPFWQRSWGRSSETNRFCSHEHRRMLHRLGELKESLIFSVCSHYLKFLSHTSSLYGAAWTMLFCHLTPRWLKCFYVKTMFCVVGLSTTHLMRTSHAGTGVVTVEQLLASAAQPCSLFLPAWLRLWPQALWVISTRQPCWQSPGPSVHYLQIES